MTSPQQPHSLWGAAGALQPTTQAVCMLWGIAPPSPTPPGCLGSSCLGIALESFSSLGSQSRAGGREPLSTSQTNQGGYTSLPKAFTALGPS